MATPRKSSRARTRSARTAPAARYGFLTVGQTARIIGVSPSTLRLWESEGLVAPIRTSGRYRLYSPELLTLLKRIKYLREVQRLNMPGIKRELRGSDVEPAGARRSASAPKPADRPLGPQLRKMRERKGLSLADAAKRSGISAGFLSAVERAHANASVSTLQHLATTYGSTVTELFHTSAKEDRLVGPQDRRVLRVHPGVQMELLSTGAPMLQSMLFRVAPLAGSEGSYSHWGEEFIFMLAGSLEIWLDELECFVLNEGDSFWFESMHAHRWMNPGGTEAVLLWINTPPTF